MSAQAQGHEPKISDLEVVFILPILVLADIIGVFLFFSALDDFGLIELFVAVPLGFYYFTKGFHTTQQEAAQQNVKKLAEKSAKKAEKYLPRIIAQFAGELIPYIGVLPWYSGIFCWIVWTDRHPEFEAVVKKVRFVAGKKGVGAKDAGEQVAERAGTSAEKEMVRGIGGSVEQAGSSAEGAEGSGTSRAQARRTGRKGTSESIRERLQGGSATEYEGEQREDEDDMEGLSAAEKHGRNLMEGRHIENLEEDFFGTDQLEEDIEEEGGELGAKTSDFDPSKMGPDMETKPGKKWAPQRRANDNAGAKGIINSEQVNLKDKDKELLQDAA